VLLKQIQEVAQMPVWLDTVFSTSDISAEKSPF
jgi:hypothetical protein